MAEFNYSSVALDTQLAGPVSGSDTALTVDATTGFPAVPFNLTVDAGEVNEEIVTVTAIVGQVLTVSRGQDGTVATSHLSGAKIKHQAIGRDLRLSREHEAASAGVHGLDPGDEVVGRAATQALEGKTIDGDLNTLENIPQTAVTDLITDQEDQDSRLTTLETTPTVQVFTSSGTWNKPAGLRAIRVRGCGGGGGGGGAADGAGNACGGCGGGAEVVEMVIPASSLGSTVTVTIGAAGAGGPAGNNNGSQGGSTSFGSHFTASGGDGGQGGVSATSNSSPFGGRGGYNGAGDGIRMSGQDGARGRVAGGTAIPTGPGGSSAMGGGARYGSPFGAGNNAQGFGGGGGGATASNTASAGGNGGAGVVIVEHIF